jgi:hypothetical protein
VPCGTSRVVPGAHQVVGPGTHRGSGPREVHTTGLGVGPAAVVAAPLYRPREALACGLRWEAARTWSGSDLRPSPRRRQSEDSADGRGTHVSQRGAGRGCGPRWAGKVVGAAELRVTRGRTRELGRSTGLCLLG